MPQYTIITRSYRWSYDVEEHPEAMCKRLGLISRKGFQDRAKAIALGEWRPKWDEPKCWTWPYEEGPLSDT